MASYSIRLDKVHLLSTSNPSPYWDELLAVMTVSTFGPVTNAAGETTREVVAVAGMRIAFLGGMGSGAMKDLVSVQPAGGASWEIDIPDAGPAEDVRLSVSVYNVRGLAARDVERLIAKLTVLAAEIAAGELIHLKSAIANLAKSVGLGIGALLLEELIDELISDRPHCTGKVFDLTMPCSRVLVSQYKYVDRGLSGHVHLAEAQEWNPGPPVAPASEDCGTPAARIQYTLKKVEHWQLFGKLPELDRRYLEIDERALRADDIVGTWVDFDSSGSPNPRVLVSIARTSEALKDALDVTERERSFANGVTTTIVDTAHEDVHLQWLGRLLPGKDDFGVIHVALGQLASQYAKLSGSIAAISAEPEAKDAASTAAAAHLERLVTQVSAMTRSGIDAQHLSIMFRTTAVLLLPNGSALSFWNVVVLQNGRPSGPRGLAVRYSRADNLVATATDCWLARWSPIK